MRAPLLRWLVIGVAIAGVVAAGIIGGLMLFGPHRAPPTNEIATTEPAVAPERSVTQQVQQTRKPSVQSAASGEISAERVATAEPTAAALAPAGRDYVILQIGDSHTAGDAITGAWRDILQARYGSGGRGVLPPGRPYNGYTPRGIQATMSSGWRSEERRVGKEV